MLTTCDNQKINDDYKCECDKPNNWVKYTKITPRTSQDHIKLSKFIWNFIFQLNPDHLKYNVNITNADSQEKKDIIDYIPKIPNNQIVDEVIHLSFNNAIEPVMKQLMTKNLYVEDSTKDYFNLKTEPIIIFMKGTIDIAKSNSLNHKNINSDLYHKDGYKWDIKQLSNIIAIDQNDHQLLTCFRDYFCFTLINELLKNQNMIKFINKMEKISIKVKEILRQNLTNDLFVDWLLTNKNEILIIGQTYMWLKVIEEKNYYKGSNQHKYTSNILDFYIHFLHVALNYFFIEYIAYIINEYHQNAHYKLLYPQSDNHNSTYINTILFNGLKDIEEPDHIWFTFDKTRITTKNMWTTLRTLSDPSKW